MQLTNSILRTKFIYLIKLLTLALAVIFIFTGIIKLETDLSEKIVLLFVISTIIICSYTFSKLNLTKPQKKNSI